MDLYVYAELHEKPALISVTNECQTVEELTRIVVGKLGLLVARGSGDSPGDEEFPYELGKFKSGQVLGKRERIRDVLHDEESLVIREPEALLVRRDCD